MESTIESTNKKILLVGSGAREHAIAKAFKRSKEDIQIYSFMNSSNPGIIKLSTDYKIAKLNDFKALEDFILKNKPVIAFIGPEAPLKDGIADFLEARKIGCVGPKKTLARLETSKSFTRQLLEKYEIEGNPKFRIFFKSDFDLDKASEEEKIRQFLTQLNNFVIKPDGLTGGKGVKLSGEHLKSINYGVKYCIDILTDHPSVIIEEKLDGEEFSLQCFCDGATVVGMPAVQDHKRAFEDDTGPNTGGMGSYSCENHMLPFLTKDNIDSAITITRKVASALYDETGEYYKGIMYGGFIITKKGIKLIEYNARLGDPEAMNVLSILKTDFFEICKAIVDGELDLVKIEYEKKATVCKYVVPKGYPETPIKGEKIDISSIKEHIGREEIFYASVDKTEKEELLLLGSRAIAFVGIDEDIEKAESYAQNMVSKVNGPVFFRRDIGTKKLLQKRTQHMNKIL